MLQLSEIQTSSGKPTQDVMRERLHHLAAVEALQSGNGPEFARWADTRLDRWLVDWALRKGRERTARKIADEKDIAVCLRKLGNGSFIIGFADISGYRTVYRYTSNRRCSFEAQLHRGFGLV
jgi:hypothetical protein